MSGLLALLDDVAAIAKVAAASIDDVAAGALKAGSKAVFSLVPARFPDQILELDMSLSGFTAGFDGLSVNIN